MRKLTLVAAALVAFVAAGVAVAHGVEGTKTAKAVTGTFAATTGSNTETKSCTTAEGKTIVRSSGRYTGTAAGDADFAGPITIEARSTINSTDDVGTVSGKIRFDAAAGDDTKVAFTAVYDHGKLAGLAAGRAFDPNVEVLANISAGFTAAGGFTDGKLGGTTGGSALELGPGRCAKEVKETSAARGTISALSAGSITVGGLTCTVPASLATQTAALKVGDRAEINCSLVSGTNTLTKVRKK
jgi:hypothetical protein